MSVPSRVRRASSAVLSMILAGALIWAGTPAGAALSKGARLGPGGRAALEDQLSWGVGASGADRAYRKGATGENVVVAMIDTGVDRSDARLFGQLSPASTDLVPHRRLDTGDRRHGERTSSLLAARRDGRGTFGIAYGATLLSIRADRDGSCLKTCAFDPPVLADAIDYAVAHGANIISMPLAAKRRLPEIEPALERAVKSGAVIVAAAGNDGSDQPYWPARYASDPRFGGSMIVAGASTREGFLAQWSNRAGIAQDRYLAAPGEQVIVDCGARYCRLTSGTSYSVAYAAGAVALLLSRNAALSGPEAASALLDSARDLAAHGPDPLTGRGLMDVSRALALLDQPGRAKRAERRPS